MHVPDPGVLGVAIALQCLGLVKHHGISGLTRPLERPLLHGLGGLGGLRLGILLACDQIAIYWSKHWPRVASVPPKVAMFGRCTAVSPIMN